MTTILIPLPLRLPLKKKYDTTFFLHWSRLAGSCGPIAIAAARQPDRMQYLIEGLTRLTPKGRSSYYSKCRNEVKLIVYRISFVFYAGKGEATCLIELPEHVFLSLFNDSMLASSQTLDEYVDYTEFTQTHKQRYYLGFSSGRKIERDFPYPYVKSR